jgi:ABC-type transport system substrate-binding protein
MYGENSMIGYHNPRVIELVDAALETTSPDTLDVIYRQLAPILQREQPVTFLGFPTEIYIANSRIKGFSSPFRANPIWSAGHLWIEQE